MALDFTKSANGDETAELGAIGILEVELEWEQPQTGGGLFGKAKALLNATDVDVAGILFEGDEPVDYVDPKQHPHALGGAVVHHGDVRKGQGEGGAEKITMRLADIRQDDSDITAIALTASCPRGDFSKVAGAVCRVYDASNGARQHLGNVRFAVTGGHSGALLGVVRKTPDGWVFTKTKQYGQAGNWRQLAGLARGRVG